MDLLDSMKQLHNSLLVTMSKRSIVQMLADCQNAAVAIGETLERDSSNNESIVILLEDYCEEAFYLSESRGEQIYKKEILKLDELVDRVRTMIIEISSSYHVVFMPYKASMWDSLESIWRACKEDDRCECYVVPIPYYEFDTKANKWIYCYEGELFPEGVSVIHYQQYSLNQNRPDLAYIHNPYDNCNMVTRIDSRFYSWEIKRHVGKLVYVPYYVTTGFISPEHLALPVYKQMDYMVIQSEYAKSFCEKTYYYDKILPFGSPKLDCIIRLCKSGAIIPDSWKLLLEGKKVLMLNTSIGCFLQDGSVYLNKIKFLCRVIYNHSGLALIWRPHPLLTATIKSMRPNLLSEYNDLKEFFLKNSIGVLDETPNISTAVAISDGYIGEEGSSVINLFGAAGKPIFILDNHITDHYAKERKYRVHITDMLIKEDKLWFVSNRYNALFCIDISERQVHYIGSVENQPKWYSAYPFLTELRNQFYFSPDFSRRPASYDKNANIFALIGDKDMKEGARRGLCIPYKNRIFYLPHIDNYIAEFNVDTEEWQYHTECIQELSDQVSDDIVLRQGITDKCSIDGEYMWITATYTNRILRFNMRDGTYVICQIGEIQNGYSGIVAEDRYIWLTEVNSGEIIRWERRTGKIKTYCVPDGFSSWTGVMNQKLSNLTLIDMGKWIVTIPGFSNSMIKLDKITGEVTLLINDFWELSNKKTNGYNPEFHLSSEFGAKLDKNSIIVQRNYDDAVAIVNVEDETYEMFYPTLSEEDFAKLTEGEDGFEKVDEKSGFFRRESKIFSFEGFIDDLIHDRLTGVRERQLKELSTLAANLDGTCGIKVHEYMMNVLENKDNQ